jgi:hypothetical protein
MATDRGNIIMVALGARIPMYDRPIQVIPEEAGKEERRS